MNNQYPISSRLRVAFLAGLIGSLAIAPAFGQQLSQAQEQLQNTVSSAGNPPAASQGSPVATGDVSNEESQTPATVGQAPEPKNGDHPAAVAQIFDQPGVLTPRNKLTIEPSLQYSYATNNSVLLVGYTVIPAILVGLVNITSVNHITLVGALTVRYGITNRVEIETKVPYVYRDDTTVFRALNTGTNQETTSGATGNSLGDVEFTARWQMNNGGGNGPYYIGTLRFKTHTGISPFQVGVNSNNLELSLPTGSGFYAIQPGVTVIFPSDPVAFFGSASYQYNLSRSNLMVGGTPIGNYEPGGIVDVNFGMGLAINEKASFSVGYDHNVIGKDTENGSYVANETVTQLGSLLVGYSYRVSDKRTVNVSVAAGLTPATPNVQITVRVPVTF